MNRYLTVKAMPENLKDPKSEPFDSLRSRRMKGACWLSWFPTALRR